MAILNKSNLYQIYFGDKSDPFFPNHYQDAHAAFDAIRQKLQAEQITFLKQVHGIGGVHVQKLEEQRPRLEIHERTGDVLLTNKPGSAIGVLTADCLPVVLYDHKNHAAAVVHAGWRGSVARIVPKTIGLMQKRFFSSPQDIVVYFGPSAGPCCYEVGGDFGANFGEIAPKVLVNRNKKVFFDNVRFNYLQLLEVGILQENIKTLHCEHSREPVCTICNESYHSARREGAKSGRQATVVVLNEKKLSKA